MHAISSSSQVTLAVTRGIRGLTRNCHEEGYRSIAHITGFGMKSLLTVVLLALGSSAWAECACFCANGELRTMCTTVSEAQANPTLCVTNSFECPLDSGAPSGETYEAPVEGAVDCRSMRVWDALENSYADIRVCDVLGS